MAVDGISKRQYTPATRGGWADAKPDPNISDRPKGECVPGQNIKNQKPASTAPRGVDYSPQKGLENLKLIIMKLW